MNPAQTMSAARPLLRWSSARDCGRKAVYEATAAPARKRSDREERWLFRGKRLGRDYADLLALKHGEAGIERERKIVWELGIGHADVFIREPRTLVEVLSSAHASDQMIHSKLLQLTGYLEHDAEADNGVLVVLNPSDYTETRYPVSKRSEPYSELVEEMRARIAELQAWDATGELPGRVCAKPDDARSHFCLHGEHCFAGWERPALEQVAADEALILAAVEFESLKRARADLARQDKAYEQRQKEAQTALEAAELPAGTPVQVGPIKVTRTAVQRKPSFDWERAELAGVFEPGLYGEFFKAGSSYSTFKAERVDMSGDEYGDEAPF